MATVKKAAPKKATATPVKAVPKVEKKITGELGKLGNSEKITKEEIVAASEDFNNEENEAMQEAIEESIKEEREAHQNAIKEQYEEVVEIMIDGVQRIVKAAQNSANTLDQQEDEPIITGNKNLFQVLSKTTTSSTITTDEAMQIVDKGCILKSTIKRVGSSSVTTVFIPNVQVLKTSEGDKYLG